MKQLLIALVFQIIAIMLTKTYAKIISSVAGSRDFKDIVNSSLFIDKTMLIYEVLQHEIEFLSVPPGFGKSVNLNMMKRFLEMEVDENGKQKDVKTTSNYDLFVKNNLEITEEESFFDEHFGMYPVLYIDYSLMNSSSSSDSIIENLKRMQKHTFLQHTYLLNNPKLWYKEEDKEIFKKYIDESHTKECDIQYGFLWLSRLLFEHYSRKVFVLIDDLDVFINLNLNVVKNRALIEEGINFIKGINDDLLRDSEYIYHGLIMGDIMKNEIEVHPRNLKKECVLYSDKYWKYFGITERELKKLIPKVAKDKKGQMKLKSFFEEDADKVNKLSAHFWKSYEFYSQPRLRKLHSFHPLLRFLRNKM